MPRLTKSSSTMSNADSTGPRRSTRISNRQAQSLSNDPREPPLKRRKIAKKDLSVAGSPLCATECGERSNVTTGQNVLSKSNFRRSTRITTSELVKREDVLLSREEEYRLRTQQLEERMQTLLDREDEAATKLSQLARKEAQDAMSQLEEHFTCALCYEIMAYPYTLNPGQCGHTFCAICILKWFFSRLHRVCGGWHEAVDCPICRSVLIVTPDRVPRSSITFPFVPNRVATAVVESLVEKLARCPLASIKREQSEASRLSDSDKEGRKRNREVAKVEDNNCSSEADLDAWKEGGNLRNEWLKRDSDGKREMNQLVKSWSTFGSHDFLMLKQRLEV